MKKRIFVFLLPLLLFATACHSDRRPADVLDHQQMVSFLADAYLLEGFYAVETQYRYDVLSTGTLQSYDSILDVHGTTREGVEHSFDYYSRHLEEYEAIHKEVVALLEAERDSVEQRQ